MSAIRIDPPIEYDDRLWTSVGVMLTLSGPVITSTSYRYRKAKGDWSISHRREYGRVQDHPEFAERLLRLGIEGQIEQCTKAIARAIDERNGWTEALNGRPS